MKIKILLISFVLLLSLSCKKEEAEVKFKYFDFSFSNTFETCFSVKFTPNDSVYIREHWNAHDVWDSTNIPKGKTNYIAFISQKDKNKLIDLISKTQLKKYNSEYVENYSDGSYYTIYIDKDSIKKSIKIHSHKDDVPKDLDSLANWIYNWKKKVKLIKTDKKLTFFSSESVLPPPPPPPLKTDK
ncbi:hypothetical protein [Flavobacterium bizetiae]|uniref:hypothetical protein n=1 Tax=Flavobacterium bizetiae TaxID=2704140 RepID=UPI0037574F09